MLSVMNLDEMYVWVYHTAFVSFSEVWNVFKINSKQNILWMWTGLSDSHPKLEFGKKKICNFTMKKPGKHQFTQVIKANITSGKSCRYHVPADLW